MFLILGSRQQFDKGFGIALIVGIWFLLGLNQFQTKFLIDLKMLQGIKFY
jgi:hypothetical protein